MITFQVEPYEDCRAEIDAYLNDHWHEVGLDHDKVPLDKDEATYQALADAGVLHIVTARKDGILVGYHASFVRGHVHYAGTLHAFVDLYWLRPDCRKGMTGVKLFREAERSLKARGVVKVLTGTKTHKDMGKLFERLGWREVERTYSKCL